MDGDDILVYWGHCGTVNDLVQLPGGTKKIAVSADGLVGYRSGLLWRWDAVPVQELSEYMTYKENNHAPGIVIIGGCAGFLDPLKSTFLAKGTKLYVGFSQVTFALEGASALSKFLEAFFKKGLSVNAALDEANNIPVFVNNNGSLLPGERTWLWAKTSEGELYTFDRVGNEGQRGIPHTFQYFLDKFAGGKQ